MDSTKPFNTSFSSPSSDDHQPSTSSSPIPSKNITNIAKSTTRVVVVPGKFDSFHIGHRQLAESAAKLGSPLLLSFSGMHTSLGWKPRPSVVAHVERDRILRSWSIDIGVPISWRVLPFDQIRNMSPKEFLSFLIKKFNVSAIVCGHDWRFGKGRQGDVTLLKHLAPSYNLHLQIVQPVLKTNHAIDNHNIAHTIVSSTRVRTALANSDVKLVATLLGRYHRAIGYTLTVDENQSIICGNFVNMLPAPNSYRAVVRVIGRAEPIHTRVTVLQSSEHQDEPIVSVHDAHHVYCTDCEIYIDFISRLDEEDDDQNAFGQ